MRILIIGANGQLGCDVCKLCHEINADVIEFTHQDADIGNVQTLQRKILHLQPNVIINTAAFHNVDECEAHPDVSMMVNAIGAKNLAFIAKQLSAYLIHVSTDYVFDGKKGAPYVESDCPHPLNTYGISKLAGEHYIQAVGGKVLIIRTSGLFGLAPCRGKGLNFVELMIKLAAKKREIRVVDCEILTPTSTLQLARQIQALICNPIYGICHGTAEGSCSWHEFAKEVFKIADISVELEVAAQSEFPIKVPRPAYSVLENAVLKENRLNVFDHWKQGLKEYLSVRV